MQLTCLAVHFLYFVPYHSTLLMPSPAARALSPRLPSCVLSPPHTQYTPGLATRSLALSTCNKPLYFHAFSRSLLLAYQLAIHDRDASPRTARMSDA